MEIKTKYDIGDILYYEDRDDIESGKVVRIETSVNGDKRVVYTLEEKNKHFFPSYLRINISPRLKILNEDLLYKSPIDLIDSKIKKHEKAIKELNLSKAKYHDTH